MEETKSCKNCDERHFGCQAACPHLAKRKEKLEQIKKARRQDCAAVWFLAENCIKTKKRLKEK